jgi:transposase-like protein
MKQRNRKRFDAAFKARVALEAAQEKESLAQLGKRYGVHPVLVGQWKKQLLERAVAAFERPSGQDESRREDESLLTHRRLRRKDGTAETGPADGVHLTWR